MTPFDGAAHNPLQVFQEWMALAETSEPNDPNAAALATATPSGAPSVRMVLVKGVDERGPRFFTSPMSRKGRELVANPAAALCFHWKSLRRQVRFEGNVEGLGRAETEEYFHSRSRGSQIAAVVSAQSEPLASRKDLDREAQAYTERLGTAPVPMPESWAGYLLVPHTVEFWSDGADRLHDRMQFKRQGAHWAAQRLYP